MKPSMRFKRSDDIPTASGVLKIFSPLRVVFLASLEKASATFGRNPNFTQMGAS